jgi:hypothetical protein
LDFLKTAEGKTNPLEILPLKSKTVNLCMRKITDTGLKKL